MNSCQKCNSQNGSLRTCKGCWKVVYCSKKCQRDDWKCHQRFCISDVDLNNFSREKLLLIQNNEEVFRPYLQFPIYPRIRTASGSKQCVIPLFNDVPLKMDLTPKPPFTKGEDGEFKMVLQQQDSLMNWLHCLVKVQMWKDTIPFQCQPHYGLLVCSFFGCLSCTFPANLSPTFVSWFDHSLQMSFATLSFSPLQNVFLLASMGEIPSQI